MKKIFTLFAIITLGFGTSVFAKTAPEKVVKLTFNDPTGLCNSYFGVSTLALKYFRHVQDSSDPRFSYSESLATKVLKSGESFTLGSLTTEYPYYNDYSYMEFSLNNIGVMDCGEYSTHNLPYQRGGTCDQNLSSEFKSDNIQVIVTPEKVPLPFAGYGYKLNCTVVSQ